MCSLSLNKEGLRIKKIITKNNIQTIKFMKTIYNDPTYPQKITFIVPFPDTTNYNIIIMYRCKYFLSIAVFMFGCFCFFPEGYDQKSLSYMYFQIGFFIKTSRGEWVNYKNNNKKVLSVPVTQEIQGEWLCRYMA